MSGPNAPHYYTDELLALATGTLYSSVPQTKASGPDPAGQPKANPACELIPKQHYNLARQATYNFILSFWLLLFYKLHEPFGCGVFLHPTLVTGIIFYIPSPARSFFHVGRQQVHGRVNCNHWVKNERKNGGGSGDVDSVSNTAEMANMVAIL